MKTRIVFVSNSSSSSFIIEFTDLNFWNYDLAQKERKDLMNKGKEEGWRVDFHKNHLCATTLMNNFDFMQYLIANYAMYTQNIITFGSYTGFEHTLETLHNFINDYL